MNIRFIAEIITIALAIIGGAVWIGNLQGQLSALNPESIKQEKNMAIDEIKLTYSSLEKNEKQSNSYDEAQLQKLVNNFIIKNKTIVSFNGLADKVDKLNKLSDKTATSIAKENELYKSKINSLEQEFKIINSSQNILDKSVNKERSKIADLNKSLYKLTNQVAEMESNISELKGSHEKTINKLNLRVNDLENNNPDRNDSAELSPEVKRKKKGKMPLIQRYQGFTFSLQGCEKYGSTVSCNFLITSKGQDRKLYIYGPRYDTSKMFDNSNNKYERAGGIQLANCSDDFQCIMTLLSDIPTRASITFSGIANTAESVALLKLSAGGEGGRSSEGPTFRNIPFSN